MSAPGLRANLGPVLAAAAVAALAFTPFTAGPAHGAVLSACGLTTEPEIARAFGLTDARMHKSLVAPPGNPSGVLRENCRVFAWKGNRPTNEKRKRQALLEGRLAWLTVRTWVTDQSPHAPAWRARFDRQLKALRGNSVDLFLRRLGGKAFAPDRFGGAEAIAYRGATKRRARARGIWWNRHDKSQIQIDVEVARGEPAVRALRQIADVLARRFHTECYPCEPPPSG